MLENIIRGKGDARLSPKFNALGGETSLRGFPLAKASAPAKPGCGVFGTPLPAEVGGDVCLKANALPLPQRPLLR
jgi:hypothetical protein